MALALSLARRTRSCSSRLNLDVGLRIVRPWTNASAYEDIVDAICAWHEEARASKVFSMPCVKRSGKVVFGLSRTGMVFKLTDPEVHRRALALPGAHLFDPSGRGEAFRQWVVVPPAQAGEWEALAYEALGQDHTRAAGGGWAVSRRATPATG